MPAAQDGVSLWLDVLIQLHVLQGVLILAPPAFGLNLCLRNLTGGHVLSQPM